MQDLLHSAEAAIGFQLKRKAMKKGANPGGKPALTSTQIQYVRWCALERSKLKKKIQEISNRALAIQLGVSATTISACINEYYEYKNNV